MAKKVIYAITRSEIGGAQNHVLSLIEYFSQQYDLVLIAGSAGPLTDAVQSLGVRVELIPELDSFKFIGCVKSLVKILKREQPDLLHTHSSLASLYGRLAGKVCGVKTLYTVHGWHFSNLDSFVRTKLQIFVEWLLKPFTTHWIAVSEYDFELGIKHGLLATDRADCIPNGVADIANKVTRQIDSTLKVVFIGRASVQKNVSAAIDVLEQADSNIHLTIYTSGKEAEQLVQRVGSNAIKDRCEVIVNDPEAGLKLQEYDLMLVTSRYEGMPLSVLEGLRAGLSVVSTDVCGMSEVVTVENGFLFQQGATTQMAEKINYLNKNRELLKQMGQSSRLLYEAKYTDQIMHNKTKIVYEKILN